MELPLYLFYASVLFMYLILLHIFLLVAIIMTSRIFQAQEVAESYSGKLYRIAIMLSFMCPSYRGCFLSCLDHIHSKKIYRTIRLQYITQKILIT